jgi:hypothetical protein
MYNILPFVDGSTLMNASNALLAVRLGSYANFKLKVTRATSNVPVSYYSSILNLPQQGYCIPRAALAKVNDA